VGPSQGGFFGGAGWGGTVWDKIIAFFVSILVKVELGKLYGPSDGLSRL